MKQTIKIKTNLIFGVAAVITAALLIGIIPSQIPQSSLVKEYLDGRFIPYAMCGIMMVCGVISIIKSLVLKQEDIREISIGIENKNLTFILFVIVFYLLTKYISFLIGCILLSITSLVFFRCRSRKTYVIVLVSAVAVALIFKYGLNVKFGGLWGI